MPSNKPSFVEALEVFLTAREQLNEIKNANSPFFMLKYDEYENAVRDLEEAHKISLLDVIASKDNSWPG